MYGWTKARSFDQKGMESHYNNVAPSMEVCDGIALVSGAIEGHGLGDEVLSSIQDCDVVFHVLRTFQDDNIEHYEANVDPLRDLENLSHELRLKDIQHINLLLRDIEGLVAWRRSPFLQEKHDCCERIKECLNDGQNVRFGDWLEKYIPHLKEMKLITAKPVVYLINVREKDYISKSNIFLASIHKWVMENGAEPIIPFCGNLETRFAKLEADWSQHQFNSAVPRIIKAAVAASGTIFCYTADEYKVIKYKDFEPMRSVAAVKACKSYLYKDGSYCLEDGDIILIKFCT